MTDPDAIAARVMVSTGTTHCSALAAESGVRPLREELLVGREYLAAVTTLLQRARRAHPTAGLFEAADLQWWWRVPRSTDSVPQLVWIDSQGRPEAAVILTDWGDRVGMSLLFMPDVAPDRVRQVVERGLEHASASGFENIDLEVDPADGVLRAVLEGHGFVAEKPGVVEAWMTADARPMVSPLREGYRLSSRLDTADRPHHMSRPDRNHPDVERRLRETSLYRPDLDLVVHDPDGNVAAYGLFWYDPVTATGLVEPMRTEDEHQRRGLARHVLTTGVDLLAGAGAERIKICYEPDNQAAEDLYLGVGFEPERQTLVHSRRPT